MEEKKVLNEEKVEEVSGGRHYVKGSKLFSPEKKEELQKFSVGLDSASRNEMPKEYLDAVSGGDMSDAYMRYLDVLIQGAKERGYTLDRTLDEMQQCGASQEDIDYVASHW